MLGVFEVSFLRVLGRARAATVPPGGSWRDVAPLILEMLINFGDLPNF